MDLLLTRSQYNSWGIIGGLSYTHDSSFNLVTMEHAYPTPLQIVGSPPTYRPKLPPGTYACVRGVHILENSIPFETYEITGVPNHQGILFHKGNFNKDSNGCVVLGLELISHLQMVSESKLAFGKFIALQNGCSEFQLVVS